MKGHIKFQSLTTAATIIQIPRINIFRNIITGTNTCDGNRINAASLERAGSCGGFRAIQAAKPEPPGCCIQLQVEVCTDEELDVKIVRVIRPYRYCFFALSRAVMCIENNVEFTFLSRRNVTGRNQDGSTSSPGLDIFD
jgi:hypothetical protein